ncbi:hypothetical protein DNTS_032016 [Danionella cerebrum]|uniref:Chemokine interleukin-8-like domain-containing protein n=1 Tax=Danionella cerebrum TaxID=2873325 RepID=A0A553Q395_9TELE|nr:hypothetical protein DNTS_032016 [Danionella translucida]
MVWIRRVIFTVFLITLVGCFAEVLGNFRRPTHVGVVCCKEVSKGKIPVTLIAYKHQHALSPCVDAIIFYGEKESYCSDPNASWILRRMKGLKELKD